MSEIILKKVETGLRPVSTFFRVEDGVESLHFVYS